MNFGTILTADCVNVPAPPDSRCSDPAFALANPDICGVQSLTKLVIKPGQAVTCALGSIQFKAFYSVNGVETDVTNETTWTSGDLNTALIGVLSGNCTGMQAGDVQISGTYKALTATAALSVLGSSNCCDTEQVAMLVMVDMSVSMSRVFGGNYNTRLDFAKAAASRFISEVNPTKDLVGLMKFDGTVSHLLSIPTASVNAVQAMVAGIAQGQQKTEFFDALGSAIATLNTTVADKKVIVLISDGEDTLTDTFSPANDPIALLADFKNQGGIVICLGVRASSVQNGFAMMSAMSTGGFFINAYPSVADTALDFFSGIKGYICAGNCTPAGDVIVYKGKLDYSDFKNWTVEGGVDLQGNGFFDYLPGNGLFVDLIEGLLPTENNGTLTLKTPISLVTGDTYRLTVRMAGNQIESRPGDSVRLKVFPSAGGASVFDQAVSLADYTQDFHNFAFSFTAQSAQDVLISIQQENLGSPVPSDPGTRAGVLLKSVLFENVTTLESLLNDTFDSENATYIPPACGTGSTYVYLPDLGHYGYATGYAGCYGSGCLDTPPPAQLPDPSPLSDIESGYTPPKTYTSTPDISVCASCASGTVGIGDAIVLPATSDRGITASSDDGDPGWAAFEQDASAYWASNDVAPQWLQICPAQANSGTIAPLVVGIYSLTAGSTGVPTAWQFQGSNDGLTWTTLDTRAGMNLHNKYEFKYALSAPATYIYFRLLVTASTGSYHRRNDSVLVQGVALLAMQLYDASLSEICKLTDDQSTSTVSQADADSKAHDIALAAAQAELVCAPVYKSTQTHKASCPFGTFGSDKTISATATSLNNQDEADGQALAAATAAAEDALVCTGENYNQQIVINDKTGVPPASATPYPSVKLVSGFNGHINKVTVTLKGLTHPSPSDIFAVLRSPSGILVELMRWAGGSIPLYDTFYPVVNIDLTFDDDAATSLPDNGQILAQSYKPSSYGLPLNANGIDQAGPYNTVLFAFHSEPTPNGSWALLIMDAATGDAGQIANGWDLTLT
jgi:subtilisin-like proprotein convertase family protein